MQSDHFILPNGDLASPLASNIAAFSPTKAPAIPVINPGTPPNGAPTAKPAVYPRSPPIARRIALIGDSPKRA